MNVTDNISSTSLPKLLRKRLGLLSLASVYRVEPTCVDSCTYVSLVFGESTHVASVPTI